MFLRAQSNFFPFILELDALYGLTADDNNHIFAAVVAVFRNSLGVRGRADLIIKIQGSSEYTPVLPAPSMSLGKNGKENGKDQMER
jgi:hypothetical protein